MKSWKKIDYILVGIVFGLLPVLIGAAWVTEFEFIKMWNEGPLVFNEGSEDIDIRFEGDGDANLLYLDAGNDRVGFGTATPTRFFDIVETTSYSNSSYPLGRATLQSEYTPAAGFGQNHEFVLETADDNNEILAVLDIVAEDVTSTSEDGNVVIKTMSSGQAATEKFKVGSTETVVNEGSLDHDFRVETDNVTDGLQVDAGTDSVIFGGSVKWPYTDVAAVSYTLLAADKILGVSHTATAAVSITLDTALMVDGRIVIIADTGANANNNNITIATEGAEQISGSDTQTISAANGVVRIFSSGSQWYLW